MGADLGPGDEQREEGRPVLSWPPDRLARTSPLNKSQQIEVVRSCSDDDQDDNDIIILRLCVTPVIFVENSAASSYQK